MRVSFFHIHSIQKFVYAFKYFYFGVCYVIIYNLFMFYNTKNFYFKLNNFIFFLIVL